MAARAEILMENLVPAVVGGACAWRVGIRGLAAPERARVRHYDPFVVIASPHVMLPETHDVDERSSALCRSAGWWNRMLTSSWDEV